MELIENREVFAGRFSRWNANDSLSKYPWVENTHSPFTPMRRAWPMLNLALISSAGAYIDGMDGFDLTGRDGDLNYLEVPVEVEAGDLRYSAKGYDPAAVQEDRNVQIPVDRLKEFEANAFLGKLNNVWWSISPHLPNASRVADELAPKLASRLHRYEVQAALLVPASRLCHQTLGIIARGIELTGIPTIMLAVDKGVVEMTRPPRSAYYDGELGSVAGKRNFPEYQRRILDEAMRWTETFDQPSARKLTVELESFVEAARGER